MSKAQENNPHKPKGQMVTLFVACLGHIIGIVTCASLVLAVSLPGQTLELVMEALRDGFVLGQMRLDGVTLLGISALMWGVIWAGGRQMLGMKRGETRVERVARLSRGTVMTETLIVIPVYLVVMLGSMQLGQNAIAGLMTTLAAFQSGRSAAVWVPEMQAGRNGVSDEVVKDKLRASAAAVVAPVVPVNFSTICTPASNSTTIQKMLAGMTTTGHVNAPDASLAFARISGADRFLNVSEGFDSMQMSLRGSAKLRFAYCAVDVEEEIPGGGGDNGYTISTENGVQMVTTTITYYHQSTMPIVARIFGDFKMIDSRAAYYSPITRAYKTPLQIQPNPVSPLEGIF